MIEDKRQEHQRLISVKLVDIKEIDLDRCSKDSIAFETVGEVKCHKCEGIALLTAVVGSAWSRRSWVCKDFICWRTFGTLISD